MPSVRLTLNTFWLLLGRATGQGLMLVLAVLLARLLGEVGLGQYAFITAVVFVGNVLSTFGQDTVLIREVAAGGQRWRQTLPAAIGLQLALSLLFVLLVGLTAPWWPNQTPATLPALRLYSLSLLPLAFATGYSAVLRGRERMDLYMLYTSLGAGLQVLAAGLVLVQGGGLAWLMAALLLVQGLSALVAWWLCRRAAPGLRLSWALEPAMWRRVWRAGRPLALLAVLAVIYQRLGVFALSLMADDATTGWYSAGSRLVEAARMLPYAYYGALFPRLAREALHPEVKPQSIPGRGASPARLGSSLGLMILAAGALTLLAPTLITGLFGPAYRPAITTLRILAWSLPPFAASLHYSLALVARGQERPALAAMALTLMVALGLVLPLVRLGGLNGAAGAVVAAEIAQAGILVWVSRRNEG